MSIFQLSTYYDSEKLTYCGEQTAKIGGGLVALVASVVALYFYFTHVNSAWTFGAGGLGCAFLVTVGTLLLISAIPISNQESSNKQLPAPKPSPIKISQDPIPNTRPRSIPEADNL